MKLAEVYANSCGVKLPEDPLKPYTAYYPVIGNYVTIHNGSGMESKNYDFYGEVLEILVKRLEGVRFIQIGLPSEKLLPFCEDLRGKTNLFQANYIIENALLHIGNDSVWQHVAGSLNVPSVGLYGPTLANVCAPFYKNEKSIFIDSDRGGRKPTHSVEENPKTINYIKPEQVANATLSILGVRQTSQKTIHIGKNYTNPIIDVIPDHTLPHDLFVNNLINIRYDLGGSENFILSNLESRFGNLVTNCPISDNLLNSLRGRLKGVAYKISDAKDLDVDFLKKLSQVNVEYSAVTEDESLLPDLKFKLLSLNPPKKIVRPKREVFDTKLAYFKSSKILAARGNFYLSEWHLDANLPLNSLSENVGQVPDTDSELFWNDINNYIIFTL